jgi:hypothetical protein
VDLRRQLDPALLGGIETQRQRIDREVEQHTKNAKAQTLCVADVDLHLVRHLLRAHRMVAQQFRLGVHVHATRRRAMLLHQAMPCIDERGVKLAGCVTRDHLVG